MHFQQLMKIKHVQRVEWTDSVLYKYRYLQFRYEVPASLMRTVDTDIKCLGEHPASTHPYLQTYEPPATHVVHEYLCVVPVLIQRSSISHSNLLVFSVNVWVSLVNTSKLVSSNQHIVTTLHLTILLMIT